MPPDQEQQRQVAVLAVIPVKEALLLVSVERDVGGVQIQHHLLRPRLEALHAQPHHQPIQALGVHDDLAGLAVVPARRQFQPVQGALSRQACAVAPVRRRPPRNHLERRIPAQVFVVVQVLVGPGEAVELLEDEGLDIVNHRPATGSIRLRLDDTETPQPDAGHRGIRVRRAPRAPKRTPAPVLTKNDGSLSVLTWAVDVFADTR